MNERKDMPEKKVEQGSHAHYKANDPYPATRKIIVRQINDDENIADHVKKKKK